MFLFLMEFILPSMLMVFLELQTSRSSHNNINKSYICEIKTTNTSDVTDLRNEMEYVLNYLCNQ